MSDTRTLRAIIFDMDDTLVATAAFWQDAMEHLLRTLDVAHFPQADKCKGMNALDVAATIHRELRPSLSLAECQRIMRDRLIENFSGSPIREVPGAVALAQRCATLPGVVSAVASGSPMAAIRHALGTLGLLDGFNVVITSESVPRGKPHPDVFLAAAAQLSIPPHQCLVFEDSLVGAQAAAAADMPCIVRPSLANDAIAAVATRVVRDWDEVTADDLLSMVRQG